MSDAAIQARLDDRYGRRRLSRGAKLALIVAGGVLALAAVVFYGWQTVVSASNAVDVSTTRFVAEDPHTVTVEFQATARTGAPLACALEARDEEHGTVGWRIVQYPASGEHTRAFREELPTVAAATTGLVTTCWIP